MLSNRLTHTTGPNSTSALERPPNVLIPCGIAVALSLVLLPFDGILSALITGFSPGGDLRRELELLQQFGSPTTMIVCGLLIWRLDPEKLRRMLDWLLAAGLTWAAVFALKIVLGRPRPKFAGEHLYFLGPWSGRVVKEGDPPRHAWEVFADDVTEIWSMPSSHTALAVVAAVCLTRMYPRLRPVAILMAVLVGMCRVLFRAHYPSDVLIGAAIGYIVAEMCMSRMLGSRLVDRFTGSRRA